MLTEGKLHCSTQRVGMSEKNLVMETVKRLLDKHAPEKFSLFKDFVIDSEMIRTLDLLQDVTKLIFEKAVTEPDFSHFYAQLCSDLIEKIHALPSEELHGMCISVSQVLGHNYRELLECTGNVLAESRRMTGMDQKLEHIDKGRMAKARFVSSIRLLSELFKKNILKKRTVHCVIKKLLELGNEETHLGEANVEAIYILFNSIGDQLLEFPQFNVYFDQLNAFAMNPQIEPRWRHMLRDALFERSKKLIPELGVVESAPALNEAESSVSARQVKLSDKEWILEIVHRILDRQIHQKCGILADLLINAEMITTADILEGVTNIIFEKAISGPNLSPMYASLFTRLIDEISPFPSNESDGKMITLKYILLKKCLGVYDDNDNPVVETEMMTILVQDLEGSDNAKKVNLRSIGTFCLLGELYKKNQVTDTELHAFIMKLVKCIGNDLGGLPVSEADIGRFKILALLPKVEPEWRLMLSKVLDRCAGKWIPGEIFPPVKAIICNNFRTTGGCSFGSRCIFAHGEWELGSPAPPQTAKNLMPCVKTRICIKYSNPEGCKLGDLCNFAHGEKELGRPIPQVKNRLCKNYRTAEGCMHGNMCNFAHGEEELGKRLPSLNGIAVHIKTHICNKCKTAEGCGLGDVCFFAHGESELGRPIPFSDLIGQHNRWFRPDLACLFHSKQCSCIEQTRPIKQAAAGGFGGLAFARIAVDVSLVGSIIGTGGSSTEGVSLLAGAKLCIREHASDMKLKNLELKGTFKQIKQAVNMIEKLIVKTKKCVLHSKKCGCIERTQPIKQAAAGGFGGLAFARIAVDVSLVGSIIGTGGSSIEEVSLQSGAKLCLHDRDSDRKLKNLELKGTFKQIQQAFNMIQMLIVKTN